MTSKNWMWAILALCGSLLTVAASTVTQAAEDGAKPKAKQDAVVCRYVDSPGSRLKRRVCGTAAQSGPQNSVPTPAFPFGAYGAPPVSPNMPEFSNPANQSAYRGYR
jgi:hypothetical protein